MRWAILTDIHANREALEAVLAHAAQQNVQRFAILGDIVGYGADPGWTTAKVMELSAQGALAVLGNHDQGAVRGSPPGMVPQAREAIDWTRHQLTAEQVRFLAELPFVRREGELLLTHANAAKPETWAYVTSRADAVRSMQSTDALYTFCGHTHEAALYHLTPAGKAGDFSPVTNVAISLSPHRQWLAVVGAVGQSRDGNPAASYVTFDQARRVLTFFRVPYDAESAAQKVLKAGLPSRLAERLIHGR